MIFPLGPATCPIRCVPTASGIEAIKKPEATPNWRIINRKSFPRALAALGAPSLIRLRRVMQAFSRPPLFQGQDLLQEAHVRVLSGTRRWPVGIDVMTFLVETMRSIADEATKKAGRERGLVTVTESGATPDVVVGLVNLQGVMLPVQRTSTAEEAWIGGQDRREESDQFRRWRQELMDEFSDDEAAQLLVRGYARWSEG